jgi:hypothetical protein
MRAVMLGHLRVVALTGKHALMLGYLALTGRHALVLGHLVLFHISCPYIRRNDVSGLSGYSTL